MFIITGRKVRHMTVQIPHPKHYNPEDGGSMLSETFMSECRRPQSEQSPL
jgi:hypothetical protein